MFKILILKSDKVNTGKYLCPLVKSDIAVSWLGQCRTCVAVCWRPLQINLFVIYLLSLFMVPGKWFVELVVFQVASINYLISRGGLFFHLFLEIHFSGRLFKLLISSNLHIEAAGLAASIRHLQLPLKSIFVNIFVVVSRFSCSYRCAGGCKILKWGCKIHVQHVHLLLVLKTAYA